MSDESKTASSFITHYSSLSTHHCFLSAPLAEKLLHDFAALCCQHAGSDLNSMIQKICIANAKMRFNGSGSLISPPIPQPVYSSLDKRAGAHHARFNRGIDDCFGQPEVIQPLRRFPEGHDFCMRRRIVIGACSVSRNRQNRFTNNDASANRNLIAIAGLNCCGEGPAHPVRVRFFFTRSSHERKQARQTTEN